MHRQPAVTARKAVLAGLLAATMAAASSSPAHAATCSIAPQGVTFGRYDLFDHAVLDGVGYIRLDCDAAVAFNISLGTGAGSYAGRLMSNGSSELAYNLYTSSQRIAVWGDGGGGTEQVSANVQSGDFPIYGSIPAGQNVTAGHYSDVIVITVTY